MFDHQLTQEQTEFRDTVRDFVVHEVKPVALDSTRLQDLTRPLPIDLIDKASRIGLRTLALSEDSGGAGADHLTSCVVMEELGAGDVNVAMPLAHTSMLANLLFDRVMSKEQRTRFLPQFMDDDRYHLACAAAEPDRDLRWKYHRQADLTPQSAVAATKQGTDWVLNGTTGFVANASIAKLIAVQARGPAGLIGLFVPRETQGLSVRETGTDGENVRWYHGAGGELVFKDCKVPAANVIAEQNGRSLAPIPAGHPQFCSMNIGIGRAAFEAAVDYAKLRVQGGRPIIQHQAIGTILADVAVRLSVARDAVWHAAWALDHPDAPSDHSGFGLPLDAIAQVYTREAIYKAAEDAAECFGAMGVMLDMPLPKYIRDARIFLHSGESIAVAKYRIAEAFAGFERP
ncbi:MAG: acyl-CoA dehydrogenase family protein [Burkholderiales bacterium]